MQEKGNLPEEATRTDLLTTLHPDCQDLLMSDKVEGCIGQISECLESGNKQDNNNFASTLKIYLETYFELIDQQEMRRRDALDLKLRIAGSIISWVTIENAGGIDIELIRQYSKYVKIAERVLFRGTHFGRADITGKRRIGLLCSYTYILAELPEEERSKFPLDEEVQVYISSIEAMVEHFERILIYLGQRPEDHKYFAYNGLNAITNCIRLGMKPEKFLADAAIWADKMLKGLPEEEELTGSIELQGFFDMLLEEIARSPYLKEGKRFFDGLTYYLVNPEKLEFIKPQNNIQKLTNTYTLKQEARTQLESIGELEEKGRYARIES